MEGEVTEEGNERWIGNEIGAEGAKALSDSLKINTSLTKLWMQRDEKMRTVK